MPAQGRNTGFHVLDEFVSEAVHAASVPLANSANQGENEGMSVVHELVFDAGSKATSDDAGDQDSRGRVHADRRETALNAVVEPLASYVSSSSDPRETLAHAVELLLGKLKDIDLAPADLLERLRSAGSASDSPAGERLSK